MNPAVRQLLLGSSQQWRNTLPALRAFVTANYNQPNPHNQAAMASPPTITTTDNLQPAGLTTEYRPVDGSDGLVTYTGGRKKVFATQYVRFPNSDEYITGTGGTAADGETQTVFRATVIANADKVSFSVLDQGQNYRFIVDGQYVSLAGTAIAGTSARVYYQLDFGSKARRTISVEGVQDHGFERMGLAPANAPIEKIEAPKRMLVLGDSFTWGAGATLNGDGWAIVAGDMLGFKDTWASGTGGTGYIATSSGTKYNLAQRLQDAITTGPWDAIVVAMGLNDLGQSAALIEGQATYCLKEIRRANPAAQLIVLGPWDVNAPAAPAANYAVTKAAIRAAASVVPGAMFVDMEGVAYTKSDATHPDTAGHQTLGEAAALKIKTALGA